MIEEGALYDALCRGRLGAAGLDVWWRYPENEAAREATPPSAYPFAKLDNVVLSPHRAGHGRGDRGGARARDLAALLAAIHGARGDVPHRVDLDRGY